MSKIAKKISVLLILIFLLGGCANTKEFSELPAQLKEYEGGIHIYNVTESDKSLVKDGKTDYRILLPSLPATAEIIAAEELQEFFLEATGVALEAVRESEGISGKFLSVGGTVLRDRNITLDEAKLGVNGFVIKTVGDNLFMSGVTADATVYAVYEYLHWALGYEYFGGDTYSLLTGVTNLSLHSFDVVDVPDMTYRIAGFGSVLNDVREQRRFRQVDYSSMVLPLGGKIWHNSLSVLPKDVYQKSHPKWYSSDGTQLSYTAQGDEKELELMHDEVLKISIDYLKMYPNHNVMTLSIEDLYTFCDSPASVAEKNKYGSNSAVVVKFLNRMKANIDAWFLTEEGAPYARDLSLLFFAYYATVSPPVTYNEATGNYDRADDEVLCAPGVYPFFAAIEADYSRDMYDIANQGFMRNLEGWASIADKVFVWNYQTDFNYYLAPFNSFNSIQSLYRSAKNNKADYLFNQGQHNQAGKAPGWSSVKVYLNAKLGWNVNADVNKLIDSFFDNYYGPAGSVMKGLFEDYRLLGARQIAQYNYGNTVWGSGLKPEHWPKGHLLAWLDRFDTAIESLAPLKRAYPEKYDKFYKNIVAERVSSLYLLISLYSPSISNDTLKEYKQQFKADVELAGISNIANKSAISVLYDNWKI